MDGLKRLGQVTFLLIVSMLMVSCGKPNNEESRAAVGVSSAPLLAVSLSSVTVSGVEPVSVTALVRNAEGKGVSGHQVGFSTQIGRLVGDGVSETTVTAVTNSEGKAEVKLFAGRVAGPGALIVYFTDAKGDLHRITHGFTTQGNEVAR